MIVIAKKMPLITNTRQDVDLNMEISPFPLRL